MSEDPKKTILRYLPVNFKNALSYKLKPIANKESLTHPDSTKGSGHSFSVASHGSRD